MKLPEKKGLQPLEVGQMWKLEHGYLYIAELGKRLIHYKLLRQPNQRAVATRLIGIGELMTFLKRNEAELLSCEAEEMWEPDLLHLGHCRGGARPSAGPTLMQA
jgi:hypothetical protein